MSPYHVKAEWDANAEVWVASSDDVPGLATGADTFESLVEKLKVVIPELLEETAWLPLAPLKSRSRSSPNALSMPNALRDGGQFHAAREDDTREEWLHFRSPWKGRPRNLVRPDQQPAVHGRQLHHKSRHWANYTLKQAGLPKAF